MRDGEKWIWTHPHRKFLLMNLISLNLLMVMVRMLNHHARSPQFSDSTQNSGLKRGSILTISFDSILACCSMYFYFYSCRFNITHTLDGHAVVDLAVRPWKVRVLDRKALQEGQWAIRLW